MTDELDELDGRARGLLDACRVADAMPSDVGPRVWQRVAHDVAIPPVGATPWRWGAIGMAVAAGVAALWIGGDALRGATRVADGAAEYQAGVGGVETAVDPSSAPGGPRTVATSSPVEIAPAELPAVDTDAPSPEPIPPVRDPSRRRPKPAQLDAPSAPAPSVPAPSPAVDPFTDELTRLRAAQAALRDRPARTIALLDTLDADYPRGALVPERAALRVFALCGDGQAARARTAAARFDEHHPGSPLLERVRTTCIEDGEKSPAP